MGGGRAPSAHGRGFLGSFYPPPQMAMAVTVTWPRLHIVISKD